MELTDKKRAAIIILRIQPQFPKTPEGYLLFSVVRQALLDLTAKSGEKGSMGRDRISAAKYLRREMPHAEICGIESAWIRDSIHKIGLNINL